MRNFVLLALLATLVAGCSSIENSNAVTTERELAAAGFQMQMANTPERLAHLKTLPQRKLFPTRKDDNLVYVYADATSCECIYAGSETDYQQYQRISLRQDGRHLVRLGISGRAIGCRAREQVQFCLGHIGLDVLGPAV